MKKTLAITATVIALTIPTFATAANAQTTTTTPSSQTTPAAKLKSLIEPTNAAFQREFKSTELANAPSTITSAWETISNDASLTEFASLVKAAGLESLFQKADGITTFLVPSNQAFAVLDQAQLARLKEPRYKDQAASVVRLHVLTGRLTLDDFTRRLPTNVRLLRSAPTTTTPPKPIDIVVSDSGKSISIRGSVIPDPTGGLNHFRVTIGTGGIIEAADYPVKNGIMHLTDTLQLPTTGGSLSDLVGRR
jgi:uncharacterized surface protein with fasciclin (FAS1) repeats